MTGVAPRKRNSALGWFLAVVALLEILVVVAIVLWIRAGAPCNGGVSALPPALLGLFGGHGAASASTASGAAAGGGAAATEAGDDAESPGPVSSGGAAGATDNGGAAGASAAGGSAQANGDLNQVPDPNCVGKTAAGLLNSDQAKPQATCGAFKAPPELKAAAAQVQNGIGTTGTTPNGASATPSAASATSSAASATSNDAGAAPGNAATPSVAPTNAATPSAAPGSAATPSAAPSNAPSS